jgi:hypothetical protein
MFNCTPSAGVVFIFGGSREETDFETKAPKSTAEGLAIWRVQLVAFRPDRQPETLTVKVFGDEPKLSPGTLVQFSGLAAVPYTDSKSNRQAFSFSASAVKAA